MDIKGILPSNGIKPIGGRLNMQLTLIVEDAVWPEYALCDSRSWVSHKRWLDPDASRPGVRFLFPPDIDKIFRQHFLPRADICLSNMVFL
jgi:hypothetical protein